MDLTRSLGENRASGQNLKYVSAYSVATIHAALGSKRRALAFLETAAEERSSRIVEVRNEPVFRSLRGEPAFRAIVTRIGL